MAEKNPQEYAIYLRKSRKDADAEKLGEGETLKRHETILLDLAKRQCLPIGKIYREIVSGDSIEARPEMQRLLADVHNHLWRGVLVVELERLARGDTKDQGAVAEAFKYSETLIITPTKTYDPNNEFDEEYFEFGLFMSRREYKTIKRRLQAGIKLSVMEGNYLSPVPPFGYDIVNRGRRDRTLAPNDKAPIVQMMFEWYTGEKIPFGEIARRLTDMRIPTPKGLECWTSFSVSKIIRNNIYLGKVRYGTYQTRKEFDAETGKVREVSRKASAEDIIIADGKHPALINQETWEAAVARYTKNTRIKTSSQLSNPLAGLLRCSTCGIIMQYKDTVRPTKTYRWFRHRTDYAHHCTCYSADYQEVINALAFLLRKHIDDFAIQLENKDVSEIATMHATLISEMEKNLDALQAKRKRLFSFFEDGIYTESEFLERKDAVNEEIKLLTARITEAKEEKPEEIDYRDKIAKFSEVLRTLLDTEVSAKEKNDLLKEIIVQIDYTRTDRTTPFSLDVHFI